MGGNTKECMDFHTVLDRAAPCVTMLGSFLMLELTSSEIYVIDKDPIVNHLADCSLMHCQSNHMFQFILFVLVSDISNLMFFFHFKKYFFESSCLFLQMCLDNFVLICNCYVTFHTINWYSSLWRLVMYLFQNWYASKL